MCCSRSPVPLSLTTAGSNEAGSTVSGYRSVAAGADAGRPQPPMASKSTRINAQLPNSQFPIWAASKHWELGIVELGILNLSIMEKAPTQYTLGGGDCSRCRMRAAELELDRKRGRCRVVA